MLVQLAGINPILNVFTGEKFETAKAAYMSKLPPRLTLLAECLGDDEYFYGELSFGDFGVAAVLDNVLSVEPTALDAFPTLKKHHSRVVGLPKVDSYMAARPPADKFAPRPAPTAAAASAKDEKK